MHLTFQNYLLTVVFFVFSLSFNAQIQLGNDIIGDDMYDTFGEDMCMPTSTTIAIGGTGDDGAGDNAGHVKVFEWDGNSWIQKGSDIEGEAMHDGAGRSVAMPDENTVAVGATGNDDAGFGAGHVRIFEWNGTNWIQKGGDIDGLAVDDSEGFSVDMPDANTVVSGAPMNASNTEPGMVRVHEWDGTNWIQKGSTIYGVDPGDRCGHSVSMPSPYIFAVSSINHDIIDTNYGHVRVYAWNGTDWVQLGADIEGEGYWEQFGSSLSMPNDSTIAIGADESFYDPGYVKIFEWNGASWIQKGDKIVGPSQDALFASSIEMANEDIIAVGNPSYGIDQGAVYIYRWSGYEWIKDCEFIEGHNLHNLMGHGVSMPDSVTVGAGAPTIMIEGNTINHARVFEITDYLHVSTDVQTSCDDYTWMDGVTYSTSNDTSSYRIVGGAANGCDSIVYLDLTILAPGTSTVQEIACDQFTWIDGNTYYSSTDTPTYVIDSGAKNGCDSIISLDLTINTVDNSVTQNENLLSSNANNATYQWVSCNDQITPISGETGSTYAPENSGEYAVIVTQGICTDTSDCIPFNMAGLSESKEQNIPFSVYPNPSKGIYNIELSNDEELHYSVTDSKGKKILNGVFNHQENSIDLSLETNGLYFLSIGGRVVKILKN